METKQKELEAHKWPSMTLNELNEQRDILIGKITTLLNLGINSSQTATSLYRAHNQALDYLNHLIDKKFTQS